MTEFGIATSRDTVRIERRLPGPIERVWAYLTESDLRRQWLAAGEIEQRVGGKVEHVFCNARLSEAGDLPPEKYAEMPEEVHMQGVVTACEPPQLLSYTWGGDFAEGSEVTFELSSEGEEVQLVVTHRRLPDRGMMISVAAGWHTHLGILIDLLSARRPKSFWATHTVLETEYQRLIPAG